MPEISLNIPDELLNLFFKDKTKTESPKIVIGLNKSNEITVEADWPVLPTESEKGRLVEQMAAMLYLIATGDLMTAVCKAIDNNGTKVNDKEVSSTAITTYNLLLEQYHQRAVEPLVRPLDVFSERQMDEQDSE